MHTPLKLLKLSNWLLHGCASTYKFDLYNMELTQFHSECISKDVMLRWNSPKVLQKVCKNQNWKIFLISTKESIIIIFSFFIGMVSIFHMSVLNIYHKELFIYTLYSYLGPCVGAWYEWIVMYRGSYYATSL